MSFLLSQQELSINGWIYRAIISFVFMFFCVKILGQRTISQMRLLDFLLILIIGNIIAHPLSDENLALKGSIVTILSLVIIYLFCTYLTIKSVRFRQFVNPNPIHLIHNGKINYKNLKMAHLTIDDLLSELRKNKIDNPKKVALAFWEAGGHISFFLYPKYETPTREDFQLNETPFHFIQPIIKDGTIEQNALINIKKDEKWLMSELKMNFNISINDILLATVNEKGKIDIYLYK